MTLGIPPNTMLNCVSVMKSIISKNSPSRKNALCKNYAWLNINFQVCSINERIQSNHIPPESESMRSRVTTIGCAEVFYGDCKYFSVQNATKID